MSAADTPSMRVDPLLQLGSAMALLVHDCPADANARDALASALLQRATGFPDIVIGRRPSGRPRLAPPYAELGVSLSRRGRLLLVGFAPDALVGVDLEIDDGAPSLDPTQVARDHFARDEAAVISSYPAAPARDLFLRLWVAKEATLKATGRGIVDGLHRPDLSKCIAQMRAGIATSTIMGKQCVTLALATMPITAGHSAYCAMALISTTQ